MSSSDNSSTVSLLRGSGRPNGGQLGSSSLKQTTTVDDGSESLSVLGRILGSEVATDGADPSGTPSPAPQLEDPFSSTITQEDLEIEFDLGGASLREFISQDDDDSPGAGVHRSQTVEECMWFSSTTPPAPPRDDHLSAPWTLADTRGRA